VLGIAFGLTGQFLLTDKDIRDVISQEKEEERLLIQTFISIYAILGLVSVLISTLWVGYAITQMEYYAGIAIIVLPLLVAIPALCVWISIRGSKKKND
jgi:protein-S-isoprenylcysteine O-methyltransferase Ste14